MSPRPSAAAPVLPIGRKHSKYRYLLLCLLAIALIGIVLLNFSKPEPAKRVVLPERDNSLRKVLGVNQFALHAAEVDNSRVLPIIMANEVFDMRFSDGAIEFELYAAHWRPGEVELREAYGHVPDFCWVLAGWKCEAGESRRSYIVGEIALKPAEWRRFSMKGETQEAIYWCLNGDVLFPYQFQAEAVLAAEVSVEKNRAKIEGRISIPSLLARSDFLDYWYARFKGRAAVRMEIDLNKIDRDTYFIRINSAETISSLLGNKMFREAVRQLTQFGLGRRRASEPEVSRGGDVGIQNTAPSTSQL